MVREAVHEMMDPVTGVPLFVLADEEQYGVWLPFATRVADALGLVASPAFVSRRARGKLVGTLLTTAAGLPGPVLVPAHLAADGLQTGDVPAAPRRVVVASDTSGDVARGAARVTRMLRRSGIEATTVVVADRNVVPPIWEGAGHHAAAWHGEMYRRHAGEGELRLVTEDHSLAHLVGEADLLVLFWHRVADEGRAAVLRSLMDDGPRVTCVLVPTIWPPELRRVWAEAPPRTSVGSSVGS